MVHEHPLHLIVVSNDFTFFDHVHPSVQPDDSLALSYAFARPGQYLLYADVTPSGARSQVFRLPVTVRRQGGEPDVTARSADLRPSASLSKAIDSDPSMTSELRFQPRTPVSGVEAHFLVRFSKDGRPVNDLEPYIGAMAHGLFLSSDSNIYLHCHPEQLASPQPTTRSGPDVSFATFFPVPACTSCGSSSSGRGKRSSSPM